MRPYSSLGLTAYRPYRDEVMQAIRDNRYAASQYLAAEQRRRGLIAEAEQDRLVRRAGCRPAGIAAILVALRQTMGMALVRLGERLAATVQTLDSVPATGGSEPQR